MPDSLVPRSTTEISLTLHEMLKEIHEVRKWVTWTWVLLDVHLGFLKNKSWVLGTHGKMRRHVIGSVPIYGSTT